MKPPSCPEPSCKPLYHEGVIEEGHNYLCWGRLPGEVTHTFNEVKHINTHCFCIISPDKGHIKYYVNRDDSEAMVDGFTKIIQNEAEQPHRLPAFIRMTYDSTEEQPT